eukprot:5583081-Amphidinium_carterae.1
MQKNVMSKNVLKDVKQSWLLIASKSRQTLVFLSPPFTDAAVALRGSGANVPLQQTKRQHSFGPQK